MTLTSLSSWLNVKLCRSWKYYKLSWLFLMCWMVCYNSLNSAWFCNIDSLFPGNWIEWIIIGWFSSCYTPAKAMSCWGTICSCYSSYGVLCSSCWACFSLFCSYSNLFWLCCFTLRIMWCCKLIISKKGILSFWIDASNLCCHALSTDLAWLISSDFTIGLPSFD